MCGINLNSPLCRYSGCGEITGRQLFEIVDNILIGQNHKFDATDNAVNSSNCDSAAKKTCHSKKWCHLVAAEVWRTAWYVPHGHVITWKSFESVCKRWPLRRDAFHDDISNVTHRYLWWRRVTAINHYTCSCMPGYTGDNCQSTILLCLFFCQCPWHIHAT